MAGVEVAVAAAVAVTGLAEASRMRAEFLRSTAKEKHRSLSSCCE